MTDERPDLRAQAIRAKEWGINVPIEPDRIIALLDVVEAAREMKDSYRDIEGDVINGRTDAAYSRLHEAIVRLDSGSGS